MKKQSALVLVFILLGTIFSPIVLITPPALADWIIDGNKVYFQDDNVYLSASPHTLSEPGWVTFELETSTYSGMIDVGWGFDTPETTPHQAKIWRNYSHTFEGNRIVDKIGNKVFNDVTEWDNLGIENYSQYQVNFGNENNTYLFRFWYNGGVNESIAAFTSYQEIGNGDDYRVTGHYDKSEHYYWQESFYDWDDWDAEFETIEYEHGGMNKWWVLQDVEIEAGKRYMVKAWIQYPLNQNETGKYWWVLKPSDKTIQEAIATDTFYVLDPWYDTDFNYRKKLTIANAYNSYPICINVSKNVGAEVNCSNHCNDNFSDIRFVELDNVTVLDHWIEKFVSGSYAWFWVELADDCTTNNTFWMYYGKASAVNISNGTNTFHWFDDYITDTTGTFTEHDTANTKQWSKNISTIGYNWKRVYSMNWSVSKTGSVDITGIGSYFTKTIWPDDNYFVSHSHYVDSNAAPASSTNASIPIRIYNRNAGTTSYEEYQRTPFHTYYMTFQQKFNATLSNLTIYNQTFVNDTNWYWGQTQSGAIAATQLLEGNISWASTDRGGFSAMVWKTDRIEITNSYNNQNLQRLSIDWEFVDKWNETEPIISNVGAEAGLNSGPSQNSPYPADEATDVETDPQLQINITDTDYDTVWIELWSNATGEWSRLNVTNTNSSCDFNGDGIANESDILPWVGATGPPGWIPQDMDNDGDVELFTDVNNWTLAVGEMGWYDILFVEDSDDDGTFGGVDLEVFNESLGWQINGTFGLWGNLSKLPFDDYNTTYWWSVNVTDNTTWTNTSYEFTTERFYPIISKEYPAIEEELISVNPTLMCNITTNLDPSNDTLNVSFWTNASGTWEQLFYNGSTGVGNFSQNTSATFDWAGKFYWWSINVSATDKNGIISEWNNQTMNFTLNSIWCNYTWNYTNWTQNYNHITFNGTVNSTSDFYVWWIFGDAQIDQNEVDTVHWYAVQGNYTCMMVVETTNHFYSATYTDTIIISEDAIQSQLQNPLIDFDWTIFYYLLVPLIILTLVLIVGVLAKRSGGLK